MHILYASNENYARHLAASICSLCDNNKASDTLTFHILSMQITDKSKESLKKICDTYARTIHFYEIGDVRKKMDEKTDTKGFDISIMARLFAGSILPTDVEKVIYLDCDTIVIDSIEPFWNLELGSCVLAAIPEPVVTKKRRPLLGMLPSDDYYNSGVLLMNLKTWREDDCENKVITYYVENADNIIAGDQDAINGAFRERIKSVAPKYNYGSYNIYYPYKLLKKLSGDAPYVSKEVYDDSKAHPAIIHYLGEERPWRKGNTHPYTKYYKHYLSLTDWNNVPDETGWTLYFICFRIFNILTKPFPIIRYKIIDALIPSFMKHRAKKLKKQQKA